MQPSQGTGSVSLDRGRGIVSFHKMKPLFCDDCIQDILNTVENELVDEAVLYDTEKRNSTLLQKEICKLEIMLLTCFMKPAAFG